MKDIAKCECVVYIGIFLKSYYFSILHCLWHCISTVMNKKILYFHLKHKTFVILIKVPRCFKILFCCLFFFFLIVIIYWTEVEFNLKH